jgi:WD40 repeat protein
LALDFSADGKFLASGSADRFVKVLDVAGRKVVRTFEGHTDHVLGVSWKADGRTLGSGGADRQVKMWDTVAGERRGAASGFGKEVTGIRFLGISDLAMVASGEGQIRIVNELGATIRNVGGATAFLHASAVTADAKILVAGGQEGAFIVWRDLGAPPTSVFSRPPTTRPVMH